MSGDSFATPPKLRTGEYDSWAIRFEEHVLALDGEVWQIIEQGRQVILDDADPTKEKARTLYSTEDFKKLQKNAQAMKVLHAALEPGDLDKVMMYKDPSEVWNALKRIYEGSSDVKKNRVLTAQMKYNNLRQDKDESIHDYHSRFQGCLSLLTRLGKEYEQWEITHHFLQGLTPQWDDISRTLSALPNTKKITLEDLVSRLESNMLIEKCKLEGREPQKTQRQIALVGEKGKQKFSKGKAVDSDDEEEDHKPKSKSFRKPNQKFIPRRSSSKSNPAKDKECYHCGKIGHFVRDCIKKKNESKEAKPKKKAMVAAWGSSEEDSDSESRCGDMSAERTVCLMTKQRPSKSEVQSPTDYPSLSRDELLIIIDKINRDNLRLSNLVREREAQFDAESAKVRQLQEELKQKQRPVSRLQVHEPARKVRNDVPGTKTSKPGLRYGEVTMLKRVPKAGKPRSTPRVKVELNDAAGTCGKENRMRTKTAQVQKPAKADRGKFKGKLAKSNQVNHKKHKGCFCCGKEGHFWKECTMRQTVKDKVQIPKGGSGKRSGSRTQPSQTVKKSIDLHSSNHINIAKSDSMLNPKRLSVSQFGFVRIDYVWCR